MKENLKIGERYLVKKVKQILLILQGNKLKIGDLEGQLSDSMSPTSEKVCNVENDGG
ncbi:MAG: hypothetical protein ABIS01_00955 [Ferruginibacter sp.]